MLPSWMCQRSTTWAGVLAVAAASSVITGSPSTPPWAIGDQASVAISCSASKARSSSWVRYGCTSIWLTAGITVVSSCSRRRWCGLEVGHADRPGPTLGVDPLQRPPGLDVVADLRQRPVDQEQVDPLQPQIGQGLVERPERVVERVVAVVQLAGDEDLGRVEVGLARWPARPPSRCRTSRPCRCAGSRPRAPSVTAAAVSAGLIWNTPKPSCGICTPLFSRTFGTVVVVASVMCSSNSVVNSFPADDVRGTRSGRPGRLEYGRPGAGRDRHAVVTSAQGGRLETGPVGRVRRRTARRWCADRWRRPRVLPRSTAVARRRPGDRDVAQRPAVPIERPGDRDEIVRAGADREAGSLEPVLRGGCPAVVAGDPLAVRFPGAGDPRTPAVPGCARSVPARPVRTSSAVRRCWSRTPTASGRPGPRPGPAGARRPTSARPPSRVTTTSFQAETSLPGSTTVRRPFSRSAAAAAGGGVDGLDPPVLGAGRGAADVQPPAAVGPPDQCGPFQRRAVEGGGRTRSPQSGNARRRSECATTFAYPRPWSTGRRSRYAR